MSSRLVARYERCARAHATALLGRTLPLCLGARLFTRASPLPLHRVAQYQFELLAKYVALDIKGVFNFQGLLRNTALARLRSRSSDGLAFADALNEGNFMVFVRDCRLWPTAVTHRYLRELFRKYALLHLREGHKLVALRCFRQNVDPHGRLHPSECVAWLCMCASLRPPTASKVTRSVSFRCATAQAPHSRAAVWRRTT